MRRRLFAASILVASALLTSPAEPLVDNRAQIALAQIPDWRNSVLLIAVTCHEGEAPYLGTGVLVDATGLVLSAAHVGNGCPSVTDVRMGAIRSPYSGPRTELHAVRIQRRVDGRDEDPSAPETRPGWYQDLALYRISDMAGSGLTPARLSPAYPIPGEEVVVVGFSGLPYWYPDAPHVSPPGPTIFRTALVSVAADVHDVPYRLHYTGATLPGVSGGPVFNHSGELLGIHSGRVTQGKSGVAVVDNYSWATSVEAIPPAWSIGR